MSRPHKRWRGSSSEDEADAGDGQLGYDAAADGGPAGGRPAGLAAVAGVTPPSSASPPGSPPYVPLHAPARGRGGGVPGRAGTPPPPRGPSPPLFTPAPGTWRPPCRPVDVYERVAFIDEGTYGRVWRARDPASGRLYALKQVKMAGEGEGGSFPVTALREATLLLALRHPHVVRVREVVVGERVGGVESFYFVMEHCEGDLRGLLASCGGVALSQRAVKTILAQLLSAVAYLHDHWVLHRDLKTANLLLASAATGAPAAERVVLKVADFGLARHYGDPVPPLTPRVVTLWYRAPELLLGATAYTPAIDVWSVGCIFAELLSRSPLFDGEGELATLAKINDLLGCPTEAVWPGMGALPSAGKVRFRRGAGRLAEEMGLGGPGGGGGRGGLGVGLLAGGRTPLTRVGLDLLRGLLAWDPACRLSARAALDHPYFREAPAVTPPPWEEGC